MPDVHLVDSTCHHYLNQSSSRSVLCYDIIKSQFVCFCMTDTSSACRTSASLCNVAADGDRWLSACVRGKTDQVLLKTARLVQYQEEVLAPIQVYQDNFGTVVNEMRRVAIHQEKPAGKQHFQLHKPILALIGYIHSTCVFLLSCCKSKG